MGVHFIGAASSKVSNESSVLENCSKSWGLGSCQWVRLPAPLSLCSTPWPNNMVSVQPNCRPSSLHSMWTSVLWEVKWRRLALELSQSGNHKRYVILQSRWRWQWGPGSLEDNETGLLSPSPTSFPVLLNWVHPKYEWKMNLLCPSIFFLITYFCG